MPTTHVQDATLPPTTAAAPLPPSHLRPQKHPDAVGTVYSQAPEAWTLQSATAETLAILADQEAEEAAFAHYKDGRGHDPSAEEYDLQSCQIPRFDIPSPIILETRGITACLEAHNPTPLPPWKQSEFWSAHTAHKNSIAAKLREAGEDDLASGLEHCHTEYTFTICGDCGRKSRFPNRCDKFFCPECQPRLSSDRRKAVEWWTRLIDQPKHVVVTVRNVPDLTSGHIHQVKKWWKRLRLRKFAKNWEGGFYALEVTNEGRGWHIHIHALINAKWIDAGELARQWSSVTGDMGNIVKVKDARQQDYLRELTKYTAKGSQIASWTPDQIVTFIKALDGIRTFGVFGALYGARTEFAEYIASIRAAKPLCACGSCNIKYYTEAQFHALDLIPPHTTTPRPPPPDASQILLLPDHDRYQRHQAAVSI